MTAFCRNLIVTSVVVASEWTRGIGGCASGRTFSIVGWCRPPWDGDDQNLWRVLTLRGKPTVPQSRDAAFGMVLAHRARHLATQVGIY
jgi:hypothetical protein